MASSQQEQKQNQQQHSTWSTAANMTTPRSEIAGAIPNDKIYVIGGGVLGIFGTAGRR
ncbi:MAG: hypothetical protein WCF03_13255 [Nitrososphaeraceae archaeon]